MGNVTCLYLIRHAEAEGNIFRRAHGQYDGLLMPNGLDQLAALSKRFEDVELDAVYTSDLYRARRTALAVGLSARPDERLREIYLGPWEDKPWGWCNQEYPGEFAAFMRRLSEFRLEGAETLRQTADRMEAAVREIAQRHAGGCVAIVSHGMSIRALLGRMLNIPDGDIEQLPHMDNASVSLLRIGPDGAASTDYHGDADHLGELSTLAKQHWWRTETTAYETGLWYRPADLRTELDEVIRRQRKTWLGVYGNEQGYNADIARENIKTMAAANPRCVQFILNLDEVMGLLLLDPNNGNGSTGHIALLAMDEKYCDQGLGIQPLGEAISFYRALGRSALSLYVHPGNTRAIRFYAKAGFRKTGEKSSATGTLDIMCRS